MEAVISTKQMLATMEEGQPFSMVVVTYDRKRKKGGQIKEYPEAILVQADQKQQTNRPLTAIEAKVDRLTQIKKNPHHHSHYTRNIQLLQDGHPTSLIKKIHPPLVLEFNGQKVMP